MSTKPSAKDEANRDNCDSIRIPRDVSFSIECEMTPAAHAFFESLVADSISAEVEAMEWPEVIGDGPC